MFKNKIQIVITITILLAILVAVVSAQERTGNSGITAPLLQYQGRLTDPSTGDPLADGGYTMDFRF